jgi:hypothetical protein
MKPPSKEAFEFEDQLCQRIADALGEGFVIQKGWIAEQFQAAIDKAINADKIAENARNLHLETVRLSKIEKKLFGL